MDTKNNERVPDVGHHSRFQDAVRSFSKLDGLRIAFASSAIVGFAWFTLAAHSKNVQGVEWTLIVGFIFAVACFLVSKHTKDSLAAEVLTESSKSMDGLFLILVIGLGIWSRFFWLADAPPGGSYDELESYRVAQTIVAGERPFYIRGVSQMPATFFYVLALVSKISASGWLAVRETSALFGVLSILSGYFFARRWGGSSYFAFCFSLALLTSRWHLTFTRVGFPVGMVVPYCLWIANLFLQALEREKDRRFTFGFGLAAGLGMYIHHGYNFFLVAVGLVALTTLRRRSIRTWMPAFYGGILALLPYFIFAGLHPDIAFQRAGTVVLWKHVSPERYPLAQWVNLKFHLGMFHLYADVNARHNDVGAPAMSILEGIFFLFGLVGVYFSQRLSFEKKLFSVLALILMLLPGILTIEAPQFHRTYPAMPFAALFVTYGLVAFGENLFFRTRSRVVATTAFFVLAVSFFAFNARETVRVYFGRQTYSSMPWHLFDGPIHTAMKTLIDKGCGRGLKCFVDPVFYSDPLATFYLKATRTQLLVVTDAWEMREKKFIILQPWRRELAELFKLQDPNAVVQDVLDPYGGALYTTVELTPRANLMGAVAGPLGFRAHYYSRNATASGPEKSRIEPGILHHYHWHMDGLLGEFMVDWGAIVRAQNSKSQTYEVMLSSTSPAVLYFDSREILRVSEMEQIRPRLGQITVTSSPKQLWLRYRRRGSSLRVKLLFRLVGSSEWMSYPKQSTLTPMDDVSMRRESLKLAPGPTSAR